MKITDLRTILVDLPYTTWIVKPEIRSFGCVLVFIDTDEGIFGESLLWTFGTKHLDVLNSMVLSLKTDVIGEDPLSTEKIREKLQSELRFFGTEGITVFAVSAIDRACWDIAAKAEKKPLYKLLGAYRDEVPAYASGLWLHRSLEELTRDVGDLVKKGYRAIKMRIGKPRIDEDVERVHAVRQTIGPNISLMVDANQRFTVEHAIRLGHRLEEMNVAWFEEPVPAYDLAGSAQVAESLDVPVASGENIYTSLGFSRMLEMRAADILMPDLVCVGGITEFLKVARMAEAKGIPLTPHIFPEESMHLAGTVPACLYVEHMDWFSPLYAEKIEMRNGLIVLPDRPGFGFTFSWDAIERYRLS